MVRLTCDPDTKAYRERHRADGKSGREIIGCLKRYVAREIYRPLTNPPVVPDGATLRSERTAAKISLQTAASKPQPTNSPTIVATLPLCGQRDASWQQCGTLTTIAMRCHNPSGSSSLPATKPG